MLATTPALAADLGVSAVPLRMSGTDADRAIDLLPTPARQSLGWHTGSTLTLDAARPGAFEMEPNPTEGGAVTDLDSYRAGRIRLSNF